MDEKKEYRFDDTRGAERRLLGVYGISIPPNLKKILRIREQLERFYEASEYGTIEEEEAIAEEIRKSIYIEERLVRNRRIGFAFIPLIIGVLLTGVNFILRIFFMGLYESSFIFNTSIIMTLAFSTFITGAAFLWLYLQGHLGKPASIEMPRFVETVKKVSSEPVPSDYKDKLETLEDKIALLDSKVTETLSRDADISDEQRQEWIEEIKNRLKSEASQPFLNEIESMAKKKFAQQTQLSDLDEKFSQSINRLNKEIGALGRRGNLNLILGIVTTIVGLVVLGIFVWKLPEQPTHPWQIAENFLPRLSLVILIELFAYFFLKLYKSSLSEIKYFQNELSNFEAKFVSLRLALMNKGRDVFDEVIKNLSRTERNYILEKGQTTVELESQKLDKDHFLDAINALPEKMKKVLTK